MTHKQREPNPRRTSPRSPCSSVFAEKLATYALRRGIAFADRAELKRLVEDAKPGGYKLAALVEAFAAGELFLKR